MTAVNLSWTAIVWRQVSFPQVTCAFTLQLKVVAEMLRVLHPQPLGSHNYLQFMQSLGNDLATTGFSQVQGGCCPIFTLVWTRHQIYFKCSIQWKVNVASFKHDDWVSLSMCVFVMMLKLPILPAHRTWLTKKLRNLRCRHIPTWVTTTHTQTQTVQIIGTSDYWQ